MENDKLEQIADNLLSFGPLFHKKLMHPKTGPCNINLMSPIHPILIMLSHCGPTPISEIGKRLYISKPNMTSLLDKLIAEGKVERIPDDRDRRIINIAITDKGKEFSHECRDMVVGNIKNNLADLSNENIEILLTSLKNIKNIISEIKCEE